MYSLGVDIAITLRDGGELEIIAILIRQMFGTGVVVFAVWPSKRRRRPREQRLLQ
jgi:hypothetical protein